MGTAGASAFHPNLPIGPDGTGSIACLALAANQLALVPRFRANNSFIHGELLKG